MQDIVHYALPLGPIGSLANELMVRKHLEELFKFRRQYLEKTFGIIPGQEAKLEML